ncbi:hypothetical protein ACH5RR_029516, partial [Cinchona calisaya]
SDNLLIIPIYWDFEAPKRKISSQVLENPGSVSFWNNPISSSIAKLEDIRNHGFDFSEAKSVTTEDLGDSNDTILCKEVASTKQEILYKCSRWKALHRQWYQNCLSKWTSSISAIASGALSIAKMVTAK